MQYCVLYLSDRPFDPLLQGRKRLEHVARVDRQLLIGDELLCEVERGSCGIAGFRQYIDVGKIELEARRQKLLPAFRLRHHGDVKRGYFSSDGYMVTFLKKIMVFLVKTLNRCKECCSYPINTPILMFHLSCSPLFAVLKT